MTDALAALNQRYRSSLPEKRALIAAAFAGWRADTSDLEPLRELGRLLHKLAGSAGGYGYTRLGDSARAADGLLQEWLSDAPDDAQARRGFLIAIEPLMRAVDDLFEVATTEFSVLVQRVSPAAGRPLLIVLVDDDGELAGMLTEQLRGEGIDVLTTQDGAGMHRLLTETRPDMLVLDFWLRDETGDELARSVRARPELRSLPAVCFTTDRSMETRQRAIGAGALEVIDKSTPPRQLAGLLRLFAGQAA